MYGPLISRKRGFNVLKAIAISVAFLMIFSTINLSSSSSLSNKALAVSVTDVAFGGGGFNFLNNGALQTWYGQCLTSRGTTTGSIGLSSSIPITSSPSIVSSGNNGLTSTAGTDTCAQQLQLYISQLLSSFQQCIMSATLENGFGGGGAQFSIAMRECALLALQQQPLQSGIQPQNGNSILNNGFTSTITNPSSSITPTTPAAGPFTQYPTTSNSNFGAFQNLIPGSNSNNSNNNLITSSNGITTIAPP